MASTGQQLPSRRNRRRSNRPADLAEYERYWEQALGNPSHGLIGVIITLVFFCCFISMPWLISFLQDEGIIHPEIHLRPIIPGMEAPEPAVQEEQAVPPQEEPTPPQTYAPRKHNALFGHPRTD